MPTPPRPTPDATVQARLLMAVADPSRLRIVLLLGDGPRTVGTVAAVLGLRLANASHHLGLLRAAGVVRDTRRGKFIEYRLHPDVHRPAKGGRPEALLLAGLRLELPG